MGQNKMVRAILAGLAGTVVMTMLTYMAPMMGMSEMNIPGMLSDFMKMSVVVGWVAHFMIGIGWALVYAYFAVEKIPGAPWQKGILFSLLPWVLMQMMASPMMGMGMFFASSSAPMMMVIGSLLGHIVYGAVTGAIYGSPKAASTSVPKP